MILRVHMKKTVIAVLVSLLGLLFTVAFAEDQDNQPAAPAELSAPAVGGSEPAFTGVTPLTAPGSWYGTAGKSPQWQAPAMQTYSSARANAYPAGQQPAVGKTAPRNAA